MLLNLNTEPAPSISKILFGDLHMAAVLGLFFRKGKKDNERKTKNGSETEETVPPTKYEHNSSLRVDLPDAFPDLYDNIRFFNYSVSSTEIKPRAFSFFVFFRGTRPAAHCRSERPKQIRMAQLSLPKLNL